MMQVSNDSGSMGVKIIGTGKYIPSKVITNEDFTRIVDTSDEWIVTHTGISSRHMSQGEKTWYMAAEAAKEAIADAGISSGQIGLIICATVSPDFVTPSIACMVQNEIGSIGCPALDINCACTGSIYGLDMARRYLATDSNLEYVLVIGTENLTRFTDFEDRGTCVLFGDGAAAMVVSRNPDKSAVYASFIGADGSGGKYLFCRNTLPTPAFMPPPEEQIRCPDGFDETAKDAVFHMNGRSVYKFAATFALPECVNKVAQKAGISPDQIKWFIPHQANLRIIETAADRLGLPLDRFCINIDRYGNTSSASIVIALDEFTKNGRIQRGDLICLIGFGGGLTYGASLLTY